MISARLAGRVSNSVCWQAGHWKNQSTSKQMASLAGMVVRCQPQCEQMKVRGWDGIGMYGLSVVL